MDARAGCSPAMRMRVRPLVKATGQARNEGMIRLRHVALDLGG